MKQEVLYFDLWHWIYGNPYKFAQLLIASLAGIATLALAINAVMQTKNNKKQLELDRIRYNREFLGAIYGRGMEAFSETIKYLEVWQGGIKTMAATGTSFSPGSISTDQILISKHKALDFGQEMKVYPNEKLQPHYDRFFVLLTEIMDKFDSLYIPANQQQGVSFLKQVIRRCCRFR